MRSRTPRGCFHAPGDAGTVEEGPVRVAVQHYPGKSAEGVENRGGKSRVDDEQGAPVALPEEFIERALVPLKSCRKRRCSVLDLEPAAAFRVTRQKLAQLRDDRADRSDSTLFQCDGEVLVELDRELLHAFTDPAHVPRQSLVHGIEGAVVGKSRREASGCQQLALKVMPGGALCASGEDGVLREGSRGAFPQRQRVIDGSLRWRDELGFVFDGSPRSLTESNSMIDGSEECFTARNA